MVNINSIYIIDFATKSAAGIHGYTLENARRIFDGQYWNLFINRYNTILREKDLSTYINGTHNINMYYRYRSIILNAFDDIKKCIETENDTLEKIIKIKIEKNIITQEVADELRNRINNQISGPIDVENLSIFSELMIHKFNLDYLKDYDKMVAQFKYVYTNNTLNAARNLLHDVQEKQNEMNEIYNNLIEVQGR